MSKLIKACFLDGVAAGKVYQLDGIMATLRVPAYVPQYVQPYEGGIIPETSFDTIDYHPVYSTGDTVYYVSDHYFDFTEYQYQALKEKFDRDRTT